MKTVTLSCLMLCAGGATAGDFSSRLAEAKRVEATPEGGRYAQALAPLMGDAMRACVAPGSSAPENLGEFVVVGNVSSGGRLVQAEVRPRTAIGVCFLRQFAASKFPAVPGTPNLNAPYPIHVEMKVAP